MQTAFIGLGVMGYPMAGHLVAAGNEVTVFNRTAAVARRWAEQFGGQRADTPAAAAARADAVMLCVGADADVEAVLCGSGGVLEGLREGAVVIDHTTISARVTRTLAERVAAHGGTLLDAPVSGGQTGAENGQLTIMVGGEASAFERALPAMSAYGASIRRMGDVGAGQLTKMVNQICIAGLLQGLSEGVHFAESAGLDPAAVVEVISKGAAGSWQMENRWPTMARGEFNFGFAVEWMRKDLGIALAAAREHGASLPVTALVDQFYADVIAMGGRRWDTSSLVQRLRAARDARDA